MSYVESAVSLVKKAIEDKGATKVAADAGLSVDTVQRFMKSDLPGTVETLRKLEIVAQAHADSQLERYGEKA